MNISFVIPVLNGDKYISQCIDSIVAESKELDEIIVVDNGSTDNTVSIVNAHEGVRLLVLPHITVSALRNRGAKEASNETLAFIDSDCILSEGWREQVVRILANTSIHATGSHVVIPEESSRIGRAWFSQRPNIIRFAKYINSGNLVVRRSVFVEQGGFDEALASDEDCEFGQRLNKLGYKILEDPATRVIHLDNPTTLNEFYEREKWHATSVLATQSLITLDSVTVMTLLFGLSFLFSVACIGIALLVNVNTLWLVLSILLVPLVTSLVRAHKFKIYKFIPELTLLWGVFYIARLNNIFDRLLAKKDSDRGEK